MEYQGKIIINAPCEQVFYAISNAHLFSHFDPSCLKLEGTIKKGSTIRLYSRQLRNKPIKMIVSAVEKNHKIVWVNTIFSLYRRVRIFGVFAKDDHTTEFTIKEVFSGPFLGFFAHKVPDMEKEFQLFTKGLKKFLESR